MNAVVVGSNFDEMSLPKISKNDDDLVNDLQRVRAECAGVDLIMMIELLQGLRELECLMTIDEVIEVTNDYNLGRNEGVPIRADHFVMIAQYRPRITFD